MAQKILPFVIVAVTAALVGCPQPAPQSINILNPVDLEAHDIDLASGLASIEVSIDLTSSSGRALQEGSFQASVTEDLPGVGSRVAHSADLHTVHEGLPVPPHRGQDLTEAPGVDSHDRLVADLIQQTAPLR